MHIFLAIQSTYETVDIALCKDNSIIDHISEHKHTASKNLIPSIEKLLARNNTSLQDISFIGANQGPGPFTSLRTVIATINGISFASGIPLVGVNSLEVLPRLHLRLRRAGQYADDDVNTICMLNAFGSDVYFLKALQDQPLEQGCQNISELLSDIKQSIGDQSVYFLGNGALMYQSEIVEKFGPRATLPTQGEEHCSIAQVARTSLKYWQHAKGITHHMLPIYLKEQKFKKVGE